MRIFVLLLLALTLTVSGTKKSNRGRSCKNSSPCPNGSKCTPTKLNRICTCSGSKLKVVLLNGGRLAIFRCIGGPRIGDRVRSCDTKTGQWKRWTARPPRCPRVVRKCPAPILSIRHGSVTMKGNRNEGSEIKYRCNRGYRLRGKRKRVCKSARWVPREEPRCVRDRCRGKCHSLRAPANGTKVGSSITARSQARFVCNAGFTLRGKAYLTCGCNGKWNGRVPKCIKTDPLASLYRVANGLRRHFVNKLELLTTDSRVRSGLSSGAAGLDLVFVFDSSASVGRPNFKKGIAFARTIIDEFGISTSPSGTRVAVVVFSDAAQVIFNLQTNRIVDKNEAVRRLENLQFQGGGTATQKALKLVIDDVTPELRNNSKKALFLITDGKSNIGPKPGRAAKILRVVFNFEIYAVGVSDNVQGKELKSIASEPFHTHVYLIKDYATLAKLKKLITTKKSDYDACGVAGDTQLRDLNVNKFRVVGGREAKAGAWPWLAAIYVKGNFRCGGALIARDWVVTVAHCFYYDGKVKSSDIAVVLGEHDRRLEEGSEQKIRAMNFHLHPMARKTALDYDLALVKLNHPVKLTAYVRTACLPLPNDAIFVRPNSAGIVAGWGSTQKASSAASAAPYPVLQQVSLAFVSHRVCQSNHTQPITKRMRCAGDPHGEKDACKGDSGAPIVVKRPEGSWSVVGLSSWGEGCAQKGKYGVYADLLSSSYDIWITRTIGKNLRRT